MPTSNVISTDTIDDTLAAFELASDFFDRAQVDDRFWKWFVIAVHAGIQGTFALALERGNGLMIQKPGVTARTIAALDSGTAMPEPHMDNFLRLYRKVRDLTHPGASPADEGQQTSEEESLSELDRLRDSFLHFNAKSWIIEKAQIETRVRQSFLIARGLLLDASLVRLYEPADVTRAHCAVQALASRLKSRLTLRSTPTRYGWLRQPSRAGELKR